MKQSEWDVVILKPTRVFLSFLAAQVGDENLPDIKYLQSDKTAYVIHKCETEEETLDEIEKNYKTMFHHEISRWLGEEAANDIESSFLDFLCCFKFELHSQIVLMESAFEEGKQLLRIKPRSVLLTWLKEAVEEESAEEFVDVMEQVSLPDIADNATVVVKNFEDLNAVKPFLHDCYLPVYETEMSRMCKDTGQWPKIDSFETFNRYFAVEIHTQLIHLYH